MRLSYTNDVFLPLEIRNWGKALQQSLFGAQNVKVGDSSESETRKITIKKASAILTKIKMAMKLCIRFLARCIKWRKTIIEMCGIILSSSLKERMTKFYTENNFTNDKLNEYGIYKRPNPAKYESLTEEHLEHLIRPKCHMETKLVHQSTQPEYRYEVNDAHQQSSTLYKHKVENVSSEGCKRFIIVAREISDLPGARGIWNALKFVKTVRMIQIRLVVNIVEN
ncbi:hypothetical protein Glove_640g21 [Diversispora epigaea]|uniref:Uncharacterized protein n=1 Tax=Diversispora epigaea TaxID=1348612 RepID=A0A397G4N0_9GLOM|nr:hypothetical protein Glove_640g21 [Diversispora epigaea]